MSQIYYISDLHLGHKNMAIKRGFKNEHQMFNLIKNNWNKKVNKNDIVYILGDISMERREPIKLLNELNGKKIAVLGNHDRPQDTKIILNYCIKVAGIIKHKEMFITHCPIHPRELDFRVKYNLHGHLHENNIEKSFLGIKWKDKRYINVSCEQVNYTPMSLKELNIKF